MARAGSQILDSGESLPVLSMDTVAHGRISVPEWFGNGWGAHSGHRDHLLPMLPVYFVTDVPGCTAGARSWGVFLLYRAHW